MSNSKVNPRYHVVSLRITAEEKAALDAVTQQTHKSLSMVVREAIQIYSRDVTIYSSASRYSA